MAGGLGRIAAIDPRDKQHLMRTLVSAPPPTLNYAYYYGAMWLDQGSLPHCVEYAWHHYLQLGRVRPQGKWPYWTFGEKYATMQTIDEWPGEGYDGTSVRAGAKVMQDLGYIKEYAWAWDINTVVNAVLTKGPVIMGTNWYYSMDVPNSRGRVSVNGAIAGGHAWVIDGINKKQGLARAKNSWGKGWGMRGRFWIPFEDLDRLIREDGEACLAVEA